MDILSLNTGGLFMSRERGEFYNPDSEEPLTTFEEYAVLKLPVYVNQC